MRNKINKKYEEAQRAMQHSRLSILEILLNFSDERLNGVVIGAFDGELSAYLLQQLPNIKLRCVDIWEPLDRFDRRERSYVATYDQWESLFNRAASKLGNYGGRVSIIRNHPIGYLESLKDGVLDFAIMDWQHNSNIPKIINTCMSKMKNDFVIIGTGYATPLVKNALKAVPNHKQDGDIWFIIQKANDII